MIPILFPASGIVAPGLNAIPRTRGNAHIAPRGWNPEGIEAREHTAVAHKPALLIHIAKAGALGTLPLQPLRRHMSRDVGKKKTQLD
jgi:hypothetical protein